MEDLKETYKKKQQIYSNVGFMEADEIDALFKKAGKQKEELSAHIADLKALVQESKKTFAVDAPDGYSDFEVGGYVVSLLLFLQYLTWGIVFSTRKDSRTSNTL